MLCKIVLNDYHQSAEAAHLYIIDLNNMPGTLSLHPNNFFKDKMKRWEQS